MSLLRTSLPRVSRAFSPLHSQAAGQVRGKHTVPDLAYDYGALEPHVSAQIMELHHTKHHQTYVTGLNAAEEQYAEASAKGDIKKQIALQSALKFNGGGHINHTFFWKILAPTSKGGGELAPGDLSNAIKTSFGSLDALKSKFNPTAAAIQGSGWCWLGLNPVTKQLEITTTGNQDPLTSHIPIVGIDMWEHSYYLQYKNVKPDYLKAIWNVVNWKEAEQRYKEALSN
ncbi:putative SOD2-superoxide dismutase precursor, mitochondrial [Atractiella rhizophila]|nr:putative SOD2-superoxide dismutase precursor, mitochondrial [Atractiella rhizophila]